MAGRMTDEALTEREKETLRLLAAGHDAKSAAVQLGLSVHTVNERLRAARRKLGVSSSRAAARRLLEARLRQHARGHRDRRAGPRGRRLESGRLLLALTGALRGERLAARPRLLLRPHEGHR